MMVEMLATVVGLLLVGGILWDSFETIICRGGSRGGCA